MTKPVWTLGLRISEASSAHSEVSEGPEGRSMFRSSLRWCGTVSGMCDYLEGISVCTYATINTSESMSTQYLLQVALLRVVARVHAVKCGSVVKRKQARAYYSLQAA